MNQPFKPGDIVTGTPDSPYFVTCEGSIWTVVSSSKIGPDQYTINVTRREGESGPERYTSLYSKYFVLAPFQRTQLVKRPNDPDPYVIKGVGLFTRPHEETNHLDNNTYLIENYNTGKQYYVSAPELSFYTPELTEQLEQSEKEDIDDRELL